MSDQPTCVPDLESPTPPESGAGVCAQDTRGTQLTPPAQTRQSPTALAAPPENGTAARSKDDPADAAAEGAADASRALLWLRRGDQLFVGVLLIALVGLMTQSWWRMSVGGREVIEIDRLPASQYEYRVEINRAGWIEWAQLEGIGDTLAHRIVQDREQNGPFQSIDDVVRVKGIGAKTLDKLRPWLEFQPLESPRDE